MLARGNGVLSTLSRGLRVDGVVTVLGVGLGVGGEIRSRPPGFWPTTGITQRSVNSKHAVSGKMAS